MPFATHPGNSPAAFRSGRRVNEEKGITYEGSCLSQKDLRQVQSYSSPRRRSRHLRKCQAQAASGLKKKKQKALASLVYP
jgi:hypothetical protein